MDVGVVACRRNRFERKPLRNAEEIGRAPWLLAVLFCTHVSPQLSCTHHVVAAGRWPYLVVCICAAGLVARTRLRTDTHTHTQNSITERRARERALKNYRETGERGNLVKSRKAQQCRPFDCIHLLFSSLLVPPPPFAQPFRLPCFLEFCATFFRWPPESGDGRVPETRESLTRQFCVFLLSACVAPLRCVEILHSRDFEGQRR